MSLDWAEEIMRTPAQVILDSAHFFPLDEVPDGSPPAMGRLRSMLEGGDRLVNAGGRVELGRPSSQVGFGGEVVEPHKGPVMAAGQCGKKRRSGRIDEWVVRKAKSPKEWRVRKDLELDGLAGEVRRRVDAGDDVRKQRRRDDGSWAPGADAEPPD